MPRTMKIVLLVSLVLNILMLSVVLGISLRIWWQGHLPMWDNMPSTINTRIINRMIDDLPRDAQPDWQQRLEQLQQDNAQRRASLGQYRRNLRESIIAEDFDRATFLRLGDDIQRIKQKSEQAYAGLLADLFALSAPDDRRRLAKRLTREHTYKTRDHRDKR